MTRAQALGVLACAACTSAYVPPPPVTQAKWDGGLVRLERLRASFPKKPYTQQLSVELFEPRSRRRFSGRGAVGVDPGRAMRMILIGPTGQAALDVWVTEKAWRMSVPAIHMLRRGGAESPASLPIGFFRSWFVDPLGGHLLALGEGDELIVRDVAGGTLHVTPGKTVTVRRRQGTQTETLTYTLGEAGGRTAYRDEGTRLEVDVTLDAVQAEPPDPEAFADPDHGAP